MNLWASLRIPDHAFMVLRYESLNLKSLKRPSFFNFSLWVFLIPILFQGCNFQDVYVQDVRSIEFTHLSLSRIGLNVHIQIHNPNNVGFKVTGIDMDVFVNGMEVGQITNSGDVKILKKSHEVYPFPVDVRISGMVRGAMALMSVAGNKKALIRVEGDLVIRYPFGRKTIAVAAENEVVVL